MKYIKDGVYPITEREIRLNNPNISFPDKIKIEHVNELGYAPVEDGTVPVFNASIEKLSEEMPILNGGVWTKVWIVSPKWDTLKEAKDDLKRRVSKKKAVAENKQITIGVVTVKVDAEFQLLLDTLITRSIRKPNKIFSIKNSDDKFIELNASELVSLHEAIDDYLDSILDNESAHYKAINRLDSIAQAQQYDITTNWPV